MPARRRFHETESDDSVVALTLQEDEIDERKKYINTPSRWNLGGFLQNQLIPAVYSSLPQSPQSFQSQPCLPQSNSQKDLSIYDNKDNQPVEVMAARDRTLEFSNAVRTLQSRNVTRAVINIKDAKKAAQLQNYSEFMMIAKHIGKNIASTYTKLEKLTLCKYNLTSDNIVIVTSLEIFYFT